MSRHRKPVAKPVPDARRARLVAQAAGHTLHSYAVGALPLINGILERLNLQECLEQALPQEDRRMQVPTANIEQLERERRGDGVFPLITNVFDISERELLWSYKKQPTIEKRFSQLKTDF